VRHETLERVATIVAEVLPPGTRRPGAKDDLLDLGLDSVGMITLLGEVEAAFGVTIPPEDVMPENFANVAAIAALVERIR
jgi:acyl carrier protein